MDSFPAAANTTRRMGQSSLQIAGSDVLKAEVLWTIHGTNYHHSFRSNEENSKLFATMVPDSGLAATFQGGETKSR